MCTLRTENFVEIALCGTISEINAFSHIMQKFNMAAKMAGKLSMAKSALCVYPAAKKFLKISLFCTVSEIYPSALISPVYKEAGEHLL